MTENKIGRFVYSSMQKNKWNTTYDFDGDIKKELRSLLPNTSISLIDYSSLSIHQVRDTAVSIRIAGFGENLSTYLQIYHEFAIKRKDTLKLLKRSFR